MMQLVVDLFLVLGVCVNFTRSFWMVRVRLIGLSFVTTLCIRNSVGCLVILLTTVFLVVAMATGGLTGW